MPKFVIRNDGSREYHPTEYRGEPRDFYATRIREAKERQRRSSLQGRRERLRGLEIDLLQDLELARIRSTIRLLTGKSGARLGSAQDRFSGRSRPKILFAPRV
jgi:hypothetical protein